MRYAILIPTTRKGNKMQDRYYITEDGNFGPGTARVFEPSIMNEQRWKTLEKLPKNKRLKYIANLSMINANGTGIASFKDNSYLEEARQKVAELEASVE